MSEHKSWLKPVLIILGAAIVVLTAFWAINQSDSEAAISNEAYAPSDSSTHDSLSQDSVNLERLKTVARSNQQPAIDTSSLDSQINKIINANPDIEIGVSIKDLNNGTLHDYGELAPFTAASVTKVLTAVDYMNEVELGHKSLDTIMANGYSAQYNIEQMIVVSDNDAWHILNDSLGYSQLQAYAQSIGLTTYYYSDNTIAVTDITKLLGDLYGRKLINESHTELLLSYMERANYRDLIIPAVPKYDTVFHKVGLLYGNLHDAAIITNSDRAVVLSIFTESLYSYSYDRIAAIMQQITTPTLETFQLN